MADEKVVMFDSDEAATFKTDISGWVSRDGRFYGKDERCARYDGCTHRTCECGKVHDKHRIRCASCDSLKRDEKFNSFPVEQYDGTTPCCLFDAETYFWDEQAILDYLADLDEGSVVQLCKCKPGYLHTLDYEDWADDLPEDGELPDDVATAMEALNVAIKAAGPVCWYEDAIAIDVAPLLAKLIRS